MTMGNWHKERAWAAAGRAGRKAPGNGDNGSRWFYNLGKRQTAESMTARARMVAAVQAAGKRRLDKAYKALMTQGERR